MFEFIKNFTNYSPKNFKGKSVKDILGMTSSKVPEDFFTDAYTQAHLQEFMDADLSEEQENAIDLLSDLKNKPEIIRKCYGNRKKRSGQHAPAQQARAQQAPAQPQAEPKEAEPQTSEDQQEELLEEPVQGEQQESAQGQQQQMSGGGRRKGTRKGKKHKHSKKCKHSSKHSSKHKHSKKCKHGKKSKRVRFVVSS